MDKLCSRWRKTGQWSRLNTQKPLFIGKMWASLLFDRYYLFKELENKRVLIVNSNGFSLFLEPRGGKQERFNEILKGYYDSISQDVKPEVGRKRKGKNLGLKSLQETESTELSNNGAALLAVCRGKVLNFFKICISFCISS